MVKILECPICGSDPKLPSNDMGRGNGHGYPGNTAYHLKCDKCKMIEASTDDLYDDNKTIKASDRVILEWNKEVDKIRKLLNHKVSNDTAISHNIPAEQMFEELGFIQEIKDDRIVYTKSEIASGSNELIIVFDLKYKKYSCSNDYITRATPLSIYSGLHKAIHKQLEELKWL